MTVLTLLSLFLLSSVSWSGIEAKYRLEKGTVPSKYVLEVEPDLQKFTFTGNVKITFQVNEKTPLLILNQKNLTIKSVKKDNNKMIEKTNIRTDDYLEALAIYFNEDFIPNKDYTIEIDYEGVLNDQKRGFYRSRYLHGADIRWIATTHFEPTGARLAFPCWDEPEYKAIFDISIKHLPKYTAVISNMPIAKNETVGEKIRTTFQSTRLMSTYLVAFVVSDYVAKSYDKSNTYQIYTKPDSVEDTEYALNFSVEALKQLDNATGISYFEHMPKMDQVTIKDFSAGAMENWGLVTYRENYLLYKEGVTTNRFKQTIVTTIAHEFAHQWFGNLVSPKWWEYIWLNEGFANYFQYYITNKVNPSWRLMELFVVEALQGSAFSLDGMEGTRPMNQAVDSPSEISKLFDSIAYQKSGSVIRMMSNILTEEIFLKGLNLYLTNNKYKVADSDNLIKHLQSAAGETQVWGGVKLDEIMKTWITKPGYPVVTVKKNNDNFVLSQERFVYFGSDDDTKWWVPITYVTKENLDFSNTKPTTWLKPTEETLTITDVKSDWILLNKQQTGYYRVNYDDETWKKLSQFLLTKFKDIHAVNRANLIDDAFNLAHRNFTSYQTALSLTLYLKNETDYIPWMTTFRNLNSLHNMIYSSKHYDIFKEYIKYIMQGITAEVKYEALSSDDHVRKLLKANAHKWACKAEVKECVDYCKKEFDTWVNNNNYLLDADLKTNILCTGLKTANESVWQKILESLASSTYDKDERNSLLGVMGCSEKRTILEKLISESLKTNASIDLDVAVDSILSNNQISKTENISSVKLVLKKLKEEYKNIKKLDDAKKKIESCIISIANAIVDGEDLIELHQFSNIAGIKASILESVVIKTSRTMAWMASYKNTVDDWLVDHKDHFKSTGVTATFTSFLLILSIIITRFY